MKMENEIQLVFFHPKYQFRDGQVSCSISITTFYIVIILCIVMLFHSVCQHSHNYSLIVKHSSSNKSSPLSLSFSQARTGAEMGAANFARRSPWPMINILRTPQVRAAQKGVPTGQVYKQNEERLTAVGTTTLEVRID